MRRPKRKAEKVTRGSRLKSRKERDKPNLDRALPGMKLYKVKRINAPLTYRKGTDVHDSPVRWYFLGAIKVAFMQIFTEETLKSGNVQVFMNSKAGNAGNWFDDIYQAKQFIINELKREP